MYICIFIPVLCLLTTLNTHICTYFCTYIHILPRLYLSIGAYVAKTVGWLCNNNGISLKAVTHSDFSSVLKYKLPPKQQAKRSLSPMEM